MNKLYNLISGNIGLIINSFISLIITRLFIDFFGKDLFGKYSLIITISNLIVVFGNSLTGAVSRFLTIYINENKLKSNLYFNNALFLNILTFLIFVFTVVPIQLFTKVENTFPLIIIVLIAFGILLNQLSAILTSGHFIKEKFVRKSIINTIGRTLFLIVFFILSKSGIGVISIAFAFVFEGTVKLIVFKSDLNKYIEFLTINIKKYISFDIIKELFIFVGWMLLAYASTYILKSGIFLIIQNFNPAQLPEYAILNQISGLEQQIMGTLSLITAPAIYRNIRDKKLKKSKKQIVIFLAGSFVFMNIFLVFFYLFGNLFFKIWLDNKIEIQFSSTLIVTLSTFMLSLSIPFSVYLAGINRVKVYGFICLLETILGLFILSTLYHFFKVLYTNVSYVFIIIGITSLIKNIITVILIFRLKYEKNI